MEGWKAGCTPGNGGGVGCVRAGVVAGGLGDCVKRCCGCWC